MLDSPFDYIELRKTGNRSCSLLLVERLKEDISNDELKNILSWMDEHDDFRVEKPLLEILEDSTLTDAVRDRASLALCEITTFDTPKQRAAWWASDDHVLMRHALRVSETHLPEETLLVETVAIDSSNELQSDAIEALSYFHEDMRSQQIRINALSHPDSKVRVAAAKSLLMDQPVSAEAALLVAANDECKDVALAALDTLCWYSSQNVLCQLHVLRYSGRAELSNNFNNVFNHVLKEAVDFACDFYNVENGEQAALYYQNWLGELAKILSFRRSKTEDTTALVADDALKNMWSRKPKELIQGTTSEIIDYYSDPNRSQRSWDDSPYDWILFSEIEKNELTEFFLTSPDYLVRKISARAFADWNDGKSLVRLLNDKAFCVRRYACYCAKHLTPDSEVLEALSNILGDKQTNGSFADETLVSYVVHAGADELLLANTLEGLVRHDKRQDVRTAALYLLLERKPERLTSLLNLLQEPPLLTWSLHCRLLEYCSDPQVEVPDLDSLLKIDDFAVQQELAILRAAMGSRG